MEAEPKTCEEAQELTQGHSQAEADARKLRRKPLLRGDLLSSPDAAAVKVTVRKPEEERDEEPQAVLMYNGTEMNSEALTLAIIEDIQKLPNSRRMEVRQESGQRSYGPPIDWEGPPPPKGCEIFVGKLPRQVFEPQLIPLFEKVGEIYEFRMMIDFKGLNRGFCFIQYTSVGDAERAIKEMNNYEILPGRRIGVVKSVDNSRLFLRGIPLDKTEAEVFAEVETITDGVAKVQLGSSFVEGKKNRGFAYVEYQTHKAACMARRKLVSSSIKMWGREIHVDWALDGIEVKTLHVQNIHPNSTVEDLRRIFNQVSQNGVEYVKIIRKYAFVQFVSREHAINARMALEGQEVDGARVRINWAKPVNNNNAKSQQSVFNRKRAPSLSPRPQARPLQQRTKSCAEGTTKTNAPITQRAYIYQDFAPQSYDPQRELHIVCISNGWPEPIYLPIALRQGQSLYYGCKVVVPHPLGQQEYQTQNYYYNIVDAKAAAAEGLLRALQGLMSPVLVALPSNGSHFGMHMGRGPREVSRW